MVRFVNSLHCFEFQKRTTFHHDIGDVLSNNDTLVANHQRSLLLYVESAMP